MNFARVIAAGAIVSFAACGGKIEGVGEPRASVDPGTTPEATADAGSDPATSGGTGPGASTGTGTGTETGSGSSSGTGGSTVGSGPGSGSGSEAGSGSGSSGAPCDTTPACCDLAACCPILEPSEQAPCETAVGESDNNQCSEVISAYINSGMCPSGTGPGSGVGGGGYTCASLSACCPTLPASEQPGCNGTVSNGNDMSCLVQMDAYTGAGYCVGSSGSGPGFGAGACATLQSCCPALPANVQSACQTLVSEGVDTTCSEALENYQDDGSCD